jgi:hypothetical protein
LIFFVYCKAAKLAVISLEIFGVFIAVPIDQAIGD